MSGVTRPMAPIISTTDPITRDLGRKAPAYREEDDSNVRAS